VTPSGTDVPAGRQIVFTFNQPAAPLGRMERETAEIPITITPALQCQWRWLDSSRLARQLGSKSALKLATRYQAQVMPGIMTENQQTLKAPFFHQFVTKLPAVVRTSFQTWRAPGMPANWITFNQPVTRASVAKHLYYKIANGQSTLVNVELSSSREVSEYWMVRLNSCCLWIPK